MPCNGKVSMNSGSAARILPKRLVVIIHLIEVLYPPVFKIVGLLKEFQLWLRLSIACCEDGNIGFENIFPYHLAIEVK